MAHLSDQDGKSKTASAVDLEHYPPLGKSDHRAPPPADLPTRSEVAERAYQLWVRKGYPKNSAEENWLEAERELHDAVLSRKLVQTAHEKGGSVQN